MRFADIPIGKEFIARGVVWIKIGPMHARHAPSGQMGIFRPEEMIYEKRR